MSYLTNQMGLPLFLRILLDETNVTVLSAALEALHAVVVSNQGILYILDEISKNF